LNASAGESCCVSCQFAAAGMQCRPANSTLLCDVADTCSGASAACVDSVAEAGQVCLHAPGNAGVCLGDATCDGVTPVCPAFPIAVGKQCDDGVACTQGDSCSRSGACFGVWVCPCETDVQCNTDQDSCTNDQCLNGGCQQDNSQNLMEGASCTDGDSCTTNDVCQADGVCVGTTHCSSTAADPCTASLLHGKCCGSTCLCYSGWTGENCETSALACTVGTVGCQCTSTFACSTPDLACQDMTICVASSSSQPNSASATASGVTDVPSSGAPLIVADIVLLAMACALVIIAN